MCGAGARVPVATDLTLRVRVGIGEFLADCPDVARRQVEAIEREVGCLDLGRDAAPEES